jgi:hypothetical protein
MDHRVLNFPEKARKHRHNLKFSSNPVARLAITEVLQGEWFVVFVVARDRVCRPMWEPLA